MNGATAKGDALGFSIGAGMRNLMLEIEETKKHMIMCGCGCFAFGILQQHEEVAATVVCLNCEERTQVDMRVTDNGPTDNVNFGWEVEDLRGNS